MKNGARTLTENRLSKFTTVTNCGVQPRILLAVTDRRISQVTGSLGRFARLTISDRLRL